MEKIIPLDDFPQLALLFGSYNRHIKLLAKAFRANIIARDNIKIQGSPEAVDKITKIVSAIQTKILKCGNISFREVEQLVADHADSTADASGEGLQLAETLQPFPVRPRTPGQEAYMRAIQSNDITFAVGPSGTGKTYLAVAMALDALRQGIVHKLVLVRPAVEAGEKLGFLPGDYQAKIDPYLRPIYDALHDLIGYDKLKKYLEKDIVEIAPLAYMRGRTLESAFIILDESQNTTMVQMKMFLTRLGLNSKMVVTGDITQIDLPREERCGLIHAQKLLQNIPGVCFFHLTRQDIVRHPVVSQVIEAYDRYDKDNSRQ